MAKEPDVFNTATYRYVHTASASSSPTSGRLKNSCYYSLIIHFQNQKEVIWVTNRASKRENWHYRGAETERALGQRPGAILASISAHDAVLTISNGNWNAVCSCQRMKQSKWYSNIISQPFSRLQNCRCTLHLYHWTPCSSAEAYCSWSVRSTTIILLVVVLW